MKIPINWLNDFVKTPKQLEHLTDKLTLAGHMLDKVEKVSGKTVIDLELRGNRADCYSILGIARETSTLFETELKKLKLYPKLTKTKVLPNVSLSIKTPLVKRVIMITITNVTIAPSPEWLKKRLTEYGIPTINNIVDLTNYVMVETSQPMHAFDLDKLNKNLQIRLANQNEKMITFSDETLTLTKEDLVWAMGNTVLSVAGAIGGRERSISQKTKNILLEAASYDRANIRRSIHRHNLFTEAGVRHEKELDPNLAEIGIYRFLELISENKWGKIAKKIYDYYPKPVKPWKISLDFDYLKTLSGMEIAPKLVKKILESLGFIISKSNSKSVLVICPTLRTDVTSQEDLIEEILRIIGYDKIPTTTLSLEVPKNITQNEVTQDNKFKTSTTQVGFDEIISLPFVKQKYIFFNHNLIEKNTTTIKIQNKPSPEIESMSMSLLPSLLEHIQKIIYGRGEEARLFEIGKVYFTNKKDYFEKRRLALGYWKSSTTNFSTFKGYIESIFASANISGINFIVTDKLPAFVSNAFQINHQRVTIGVGGKINKILYAEFDLDSLLKKETPSTVSLWPKYPPQIEDITLIIPPETYIGNLINFALQSNKEITKMELVDIYKRNYTFKVFYQNPNHTLSNTEVEKIREKLLAKLSSNFGTSTV